MTERSFYPPERQEAILRLAREQGRVEVAALADTFQVTTETVRRDLSVLQKRRLLRRVHGGAILWGQDGFEPLLADRDTRRVEEKRRIALAAIEELPPEGTVLLDSGSTLARVAQHLPTGLDLRIVTNSLLNIQLLAEHEDAEVIVLGGGFHKETLATVDEQTVREIAALHVDVVLLGSDGVSPQGGLSSPYRNHAEVKRAMVASAGRVVALVDSSKIPKDYFVRFATCREIDTLITDDDLSDDLAADLGSAGMRVVRV